MFVLPQAFSRQDKVSRHIKSVHEQRQDRVCTLCSKAFARQDKLTAHMKSVHGSKTIPPCETCEGLFERVMSFMRTPYGMDFGASVAKVCADFDRGQLFSHVG